MYFHSNIHSKQADRTNTHVHKDHPAAKMKSVLTAPADQHTGQPCSSSTVDSKSLEAEEFDTFLQNCFELHSKTVYFLSIDFWF